MKYYLIFQILLFGAALIGHLEEMPEPGRTSRQHRKKIISIAICTVQVAWALALLVAMP